MSRLKKISLVFFGGFVGVITLLLTTWLLINLGEGELSREVRARLDSRRPVSDKRLEGYKYELGLFAPADENPLDAGEKFYAEALARKPDQAVQVPDALKPSRNPKWCVRNGDYCSALDRKLHSKEIKALLSENEVLLKRFDHLLKYAGAAGDLKPSVLVRTNQFGLASLAELKRLEWSERLANDDREAVWREWKGSNEFFQEKLRSPMTALDASLWISVLTNNRAFMRSAMQDSARLRPSDEFLRSAELAVADSEIEANLILGELEVVEGITKMEIREGFFNLADSEPPRIDFAKLTEPWFRRQQTLSEAERRITEDLKSPCMTNDRTCGRRDYLTFSESIRNPLGNFVVSVMTAYIPARIKDLRTKTAELRKPFSATEPSS